VRSLSTNALAKIAQHDGAIPINRIEVQWVDGGQRHVYTDLDFIMSLAPIDNVTQVSGSGQSQAVSVTLKDIDGSIKKIIDTNDIHLRSCWVYQSFDGLADSDKFLIFRGQINTPIVWKEGDRTVTFDVISKIEDAEVGFSIEEGDFVAPDPNLIGKAWPLCFGTVINAPALMLTTPRQGTLATGVGIKDWTLDEKLAAANKLLCAYEFKGYDFIYQSSGTHDFRGAQGGAEIFPIWAEQSGCAESRCHKVKELEGEISAQHAFEFQTIQVFNGENFPQGVPLKLNINNGVFEGSFSGQTFTITGRTHPDLAHPIIDTALDITIDVTGCQQPPSIYQKINTKPANTGPTSDQVQASQDAFNAIPSSRFFWANAGATVTIEGDQQTTYIANILPSTILRVAAFRNTDAGRVLVTVPPGTYTIQQVDYTGYQVMEIVFGQPLSAVGVGWTDEVYVTLTSSVGPNTADVLQWFIQTYTQHTVDAASFAHVRALIDNYPSHFMMPGRMNIIQALDQISYQARCAVWLKDDTFYLKYLSEEPTSNDTIGPGDILADSLQITHTKTEELITKYIATWQLDYSIKDKNTIIYRSNVKKYGTHTLTYDYYIYNIVDLVRKSATFWLIRKANTWRKLSFKTPLTKLDLEVFDTMTVNLAALSGAPIKALIETASYDSSANAIDFECWTPLRSGETTPYNFAWPADVSETLIYPTPPDRLSGFAGGNNGPNFTVKAPPNSPQSNVNQFIQGFRLECNGKPIRRVTAENIECHSDFGMQKPSDRTDTKPTPKAGSDNSNVQGTYNPLPQSGNSGPSCCQDALNVAQEALKEARTAMAAAGSGAGSAGSGSSDDPSQADKKRLPKKADKQKDGNCLYITKVDYITVLQVNRPGGYTYTDETGTHTGVPRSSRAGDSGEVNESAPAGTESIGFNSLDAAQSYAQGVLDQITALHSGYGYVVGQRQPLTVEAAIGPEPVPPGSPPCTDATHGPDGTQPKMVSFDTTEGS
jgi:hypothetical protein